jgi:hypothetical protein
MMIGFLPRPALDSIWTNRTRLNLLVVFAQLPKLLLGSTFPVLFQCVHERGSRVTIQASVQSLRFFVTAPACEQDCERNSRYQSKAEIQKKVRLHFHFQLKNNKGNANVFHRNEFPSPPRIAEAD